MSTRPEASPFATTHWSVVLTARDESDPAVEDALSRLCQLYWPPLFAFLRRQGYSAPDAEDLVQGFFARLLEERFLREVGKEKGRFRSFLLAALRHHVANVHRHHRTQRRGGNRIHVAIQDVDLGDRCDAALATGADAEVLYDRLWAETVLAKAAASLRQEHEDAGRGPWFEAVRAWLAVDAAPGEYAAAAERFGMTEGAVAVAVHRLRQRFRRLVRAEVAHTVSAPDQIEEEMSHLLRVLTRM